MSVSAQPPIDIEAKRKKMKQSIDLLLQAEKEMQTIRTELKRLQIEEQSLLDKEDLHGILQKISQFK